MEKLGIESAQLLTQMVNFAIMLIVLTKILYKPILKALDERRKKIAEGLAYAEKMKEEEEKTEQKREQILAKAKEEGRELIEQAKKSAKDVESEIVQKAHEEAKLVKERGEADVELARADMKKQLNSEAVAIAEGIVQALLGETLTKREQEDLIDRKLKEVAKGIATHEK